VQSRQNKGLIAELARAKDITEDATKIKAGFCREKFPADKMAFVP
jgi:hypothetical protein